MELALSIEQWIATLEHELCETDRSALHAQLELWSRFSAFPDFPQAGTDVFKGWMPDRYLDWTVMEFKFNLKPASGSFWKRLKAGLLWLFKKSPAILIQDVEYVLVGSSDKNAMKVKVRFEKIKGEIKSSFEIEDSLLKDTA